MPTPLPLTKLTETSTKITLGWSPAPGAIGYRFQSETTQPKWSHTFDATRDQVTFSKAAWYKVEALGVEAAGEYPAVSPPPPPPPTGSGFKFPCSFHIWGGNSAAAMLTHDFVVASDASQGNPKAARASNPGLVAMFHPGLDPFNSDWQQRKTSALTYGGGFRNWTGGTDNLQPNPQGTLRAWASSDNGCMQEDGIQGFALHKPATAELVKKLAFYAWKLGKGAENGWNGIWSDNLAAGNNIHAGWFYGSGCPIGNDEWDVGFISLLQGLRDLGVPIVGGNVSYRASKQSTRVVTQASLHEVLQITVGQGANQFATVLSEIKAWRVSSPEPHYFAFMDLVPQSDTSRMRFGLALATIAGGSYMPYGGSHSDLYLPSEMKKNGQRHYLGLPLADETRSGNTWTRRFEHGTVTANYDSRIGTFS